MSIVEYSPQFRSHQETKMAAVGLNDRHPRSHGKIGDCGQSTRAGDENGDTIELERKRTIEPEHCLLRLVTVNTRWHWQRDWNS